MERHVVRGRGRLVQRDARQEVERRRTLLLVDPRRSPPPRHLAHGSSDISDQPRAPTILSSNQVVIMLKLDVKTAPLCSKMPVYGTRTPPPTLQRVERFQRLHGGSPPWSGPGRRRLRGAT